MTRATDDGFGSLAVSPAQRSNLERLGYLSMTPIQAASLPAVLAGKDVIAKAKTGSGKTAAFGIGLLERINPRSLATQALVLCPTRELADQVTGELRRLARAVPNCKLLSLVGGKPFGPQKGSLAHGAHVVVGTPGRVLDHLQKGNLKLDGLRMLVLDEADRMLAMGFADAMDAIIAETPKKRQTLLFSATYPDAIAAISRKIQKAPVSATVEAVHRPQVIEQLFYQVRTQERNAALLALFQHYRPTSALVFCHTRKQCTAVNELLKEHRIESLAIHGDLEQRERDEVLAQFANNSCPVLVATDVAARGLDIKLLEAVFNYELPRDPEVYVHRIGRTGRAGEKGLALSLFTEAEQRRLAPIEGQLGTPCLRDTPASLDRDSSFRLAGKMATLELNAGRKQKLRPGDLLGALTGEAGLAGDDIGRIDILDTRSFVAVDRSVAKQALRFLAEGKVKGRSLRARRLR
ncbi:ATP-dependent RNA helicase DbpA [Pseudohaliea rubra]|uniref:ATP-dependent 23S rRNA helicase DbpA n=1 Tax=Pseudohaliea rubra DSM 19751 TaxID=1265313 RepID=A0A095XSV7_9GAMM|nr:ATP-dependent RNA helicase DbpA [Pseudohaliea rubra]KGE02751.1 ATP-dependent 23S rRNA helicase DbpA [Pseudohaliea rubra DSM 19751]